MNITELRRALSDELHARAFHEFDGAGRFIRFVFMTEDNLSAMHGYVNAFLQERGKPPIEAESKFARIEFDDFALRFERHTEFLSISLIEKGLAAKAGLLPDAFDKSQSRLPLDWAGAAPATLFHAIWIEIGGKPPRGLDPESMLTVMDSRAIAANRLGDGTSQLHFAFDIDKNGFSRVALYNSDITASRMGRTVQRVVEFETYRLLAMLGFAAVQDNSQKLSQIETEVGKLTTQLAVQIKNPGAKVESLLSTLSRQAADLEDISSQTSYRLSATTAYESILADRLAGLGLSRLDGFQGVRGFLNRRMTPAMDSCRAFAERMASLSERIGRAGDLLQTQTEMIIQRQNRDLLRSMNRRAKAQLHLQQTVERLSIAAVTYYGVGLVGYLALPLPLDAWGIDLLVVKAASVPIIAFFVWLAIHRVKQGLKSDD